MNRREEANRAQRLARDVRTTAFVAGQTYVTYLARLWEEDAILAARGQMPRCEIWPVDE